MLLPDIIYHSLLFYKKQIKNSGLSKNKKCSLQVQINSRRIDGFVKRLRALCTASCPASFTVEAALVLPIMIFAVCAFLYFLIILNTQVALHEELVKNARNMSRYAFTYEEIMDMTPSQEEELKKEMEPELKDVLFHGFSSAYALEQMKKGIGKERLDQSCIKHGADGLSLLGESLISDNRMVDMTLRYQVRIPYISVSLSCVQRVRIRTFTGFMPSGEEGGTEAEEIVYITETGSVYHTNKYCTHLNLSVKAVDSANVASMRNSNGGKYYACELCEGIPETFGTVYLTVHGDRYHTSPGCTGLKRSWKAVLLSEAEGRTLCKRCQKQEKGGE